MNMTPEQMQGIMATGQNDPQQAAVARQQALLAKLRAQGMQAAPTQMAGRVALPNYGQVGANMMATHAANKMQPGVEESERGLVNRQNEARKQYLDMMMMAMRKQYPQQPQPMLPPDGMEDR